MLRPYYQGESLAQELRAGRPEPARAREVLRQVLDGLNAVHAQHLLHRDVKPENIYLVEGGPAVLLDFGAARRAIVEGTRTATANNAFTAGYGALEQYGQEGAIREGPWTDVYGLGATMYHWLTGNRPWDAPDRVIEDRLKPLSEARLAGYPPGWLAAVDKALALKPQDRFQSVAEWQQALGGASPGAETRHAPRETNPAPWRGWVIGLGLGLGVAVAGGLMWIGREPQTDPGQQPQPPPAAAAPQNAPAELQPPAAPVVAGPMVRIPGGCFQMGSPVSEADRRDNEHQHRVCVEAFEIGKYEVTQGEWQAVMGNNPSRFSGCSNCPVEQVSWNDVQDYLGKLNQRTGQSYRLPTEAEWEYAARAGTTTAFWTGRCVTTDQANYDGNYGLSDSACRAKAGVYRAQTLPVGSFPANPWGLHDTMGNVWEWTCSLYDENYGGAEQKCTNKGTSGPLAMRGGSWVDKPGWVRSADRFRFRLSPANRGDDRGFRLARSL